MAPISKSSMASDTQESGKRTSRPATSRSSTMSSANTTISSVSTTASKSHSTTAANRKQGNGTSAVRTISRAAPSKTTATTSRMTNNGSVKVLTRPTSPTKKVNNESSEIEAIKAYLRIRPTPLEAAKMEEEPYIEVISEVEVLMSPPKSSTAARARVYSTAMPTKYSFSHVFPGHPTTSQSAFFQQTTLPLVDELMQGQSGLIFTYGVTNSGKSFTVQGGAGVEEAGILPRSMDTIFNSIKGLESTSDVRPVGLAGVERVNGDQSTPGGIDPFSIPGLSKKLPTSSRPALYEHDPTKVRVDRNYRYSIWVSYVEVYNEKIFDLLDAAPPSSSTSRPSTFGGGLTRSDSVRGSNWTLASLMSDNGPIYLQRRPLTLKNDVETGGKYVAGLQEIRVKSAAEARELLLRGQGNRQVFGTMANRASSRSHGVFTVKVIREHAGESDSTIACSTSRLSIVDLAGSERLGNTAVTGDRLKEAGSINKSLMCLGQCLETLRKNQTRAASFVPMPTPISSTAGSTSSLAPPRTIKRRPSIVPFRHSKLTELFQSFFTGEGRAVMIVNVNPFDTGFDENSHVMRFSAAAKEVQTIRSQGQTTNLSRFVHPSLRDLFHPGASPVQSPAPKMTAAIPTPMSSSVSAAVKKVADRVIAAKQDSRHHHQQQQQSKAKAVAPSPAITPSPTEQEVTIIEENDAEDEEEQSDSFVDHLMVKYEEVRHRLYQSERQCAQIEAQVREEMAEEMSRRLQEMESIFSARMLADSSMQDDFINRKLDLIGKAAARTKARKVSEYDEEGEEEEEESEDENDEEGDDDDDEVEQSLPSHKHSSEAVLLNEDSMMSEVEAGEEVGEDSILVTLSRKKAGTIKRISPESEDETSMIEHDVVSKASPEVSLAKEGGSADQTVEDFYSDEEEEDDGDEEEDEDESEDEEDDEEEEEESSDESFDVSSESIESSFEAAPKRTSRGRLSKPVITTKKPVKATKATAPNRKRSTVTSRKSINGLPLVEKSANISLDPSSDGSLVLAEKPIKSPKKKRLLAKKTNFDDEDLLDQLGMED